MSNIYKGECTSSCKSQRVVASHSTEKFIPPITVEPKGVQCRRGIAVGFTELAVRPRTKEFIATFKEEGPELFPGLVPFRIMIWFVIATSTKGCGELLDPGSLLWWKEHSLNTHTR